MQGVQANAQEIEQLNKKSDMNALIDLSFEDNDDANIEIVTVPTIESDKNEDVIDTIPAKKARNKFTWVTHSTYTNLDEALDFLESEGFVYYDDSDLICGQKFYYRCKKTPKAKKPYCDRRYVLFLPSENNSIILQHNCRDHNHDALLAGKKQSPSDVMVDFLVDLFKAGTTKTQNVLSHIDLARTKHKLFQSEPDPDKRQIEYCLRKFRNSEIKPMINVGDLMEWCNSNAEFPSDENDAFVLSHESNAMSESLGFRFTMTTPLLLKKFIALEKICIDATYKLNWLGYPLIVLGTVDRMKKFHPLLYACTSHERTEDYAFVFQSVKDGLQIHFNEIFQPETLIADGADAIRNAFYNTFDSAKLDVMCFAHVIRNIKKRPFANKNNKELILDDIRKMQSSSNRKMFEMMAKLFGDKWENIEPNFVEYFKKQWLGVHSNWFEGAAEYTPSTNNALESHNATIKRKITLRKRLPMNQFLSAMNEMTSSISKQFSNDLRIISIEPTIKKEMINNAALMQRAAFKCFKAKSSTKLVSIFLVPSQKCDDHNATEKYYKELVKRNWTSFDEFVRYGFQIFYIVQLSSVSWNTESKCSCTAFFKQNICKHILAVAFRENIIDCPDSANPTLLAPSGSKKLGRKPKSTKALVVQ